LLEKRRPKTCDHFFCYVPPKKLCELHPLRCNFLIFFLPPLPETKKVLLFTALHKTAQKTSTRRTPRQRWILKDITEETKMKRKDLFLFHFFFFFLETSSNFANSMDSGLEGSAIIPQMVASHHIGCSARRIHQISEPAVPLVLDWITGEMRHLLLLFFTFQLNKFSLSVG